MDANYITMQTTVILMSTSTHFLQSSVLSVVLRILVDPLTTLLRGGWGVGDGEGLELKVTQKGMAPIQFSIIQLLPITHSVPPPPSPFYINYCCEVLSGGLHFPKSISQQSFMQNLGANRVNNVQLENREYPQVLR